MATTAKVIELQSHVTRCSHQIEVWEESALEVTLPEHLLAKSLSRLRKVRDEVKSAKSVVVYSSDTKVMATIVIFNAQCQVLLNRLASLETRLTLLATAGGWFALRHALEDSLASSWDSLDCGNIVNSVIVAKVCDGRLYDPAIPFQAGFITALRNEINYTGKIYSAHKMALTKVADERPLECTDA